jgi:transposase
MTVADSSESSTRNRLFYFSVASIAIRLEALIMAKVMEAIFRCCAGLDVHSKTVAACVRCVDDQGQIHAEVRTFGTMTRDLLALMDWLVAEGVSHVAMESTGVFWKPVYNILEEQFQILLVNARHIKNVPGRKTDVKDCEWIAQLLQCGLLRGSFIPPRPQRELRDLTRMRTQLTREMSSVANRIHKVLEDTNIKVGVVATDILGVSGRRMIHALLDGETDTAKMADMARGRLRDKIPLLKEALVGKVTEHHQFLLKQLMNHLTYLEGQIEVFNQRIEQAARPFEKAIAALIPMPGYERASAQSVIAEIGPDMTVFRTDAHLCSWAKICPGNNESAGKRKSGATGHGNRWLRTILVQVAWAASHKKGSYFQAQYRRLAGRRGKKKAIVAVAHSILTVTYYVLKFERSYKDLGVDHFDRIARDRMRRYHIKRLESLGYKVELTEKEAA